jgi:NAD(P)-dependent dehydrogenase (short-subunit alcohol dehydrogenase family)
VKYFLPAMRKKRWGRFVGISSNMVGLAIPRMSHYIATKMGIIGFMRGLANDVANDGITANRSVARSDQYTGDLAAI